MWHHKVQDAETSRWYHSSGDFLPLFVFAADYGFFKPDYVLLELLCMAIKWKLQLFEIIVNPLKMSSKTKWKYAWNSLYFLRYSVAPPAGWEGVVWALDPEGRRRMFRTTFAKKIRMKSCNDGPTSKNFRRAHGSKMLKFYGIFLWNFGRIISYKRISVALLWIQMNKVGWWERTCQLWPHLPNPD